MMANWRGTKCIIKKGHSDWNGNIGETEEPEITERPRLDKHCAGYTLRTWFIAKYEHRPTHGQHQRDNINSNRL